MDDEVRPWGRYDVLAEDDTFKVKSITVAPGERLSYQRHTRRSEHWFIVKGHGAIMLHGVITTVGPGTAVDVPAGACHRD